STRKIIKMPSNADTFDKRVELVREAVSKNKGEMPKNERPNKDNPVGNTLAANLLTDMTTIVQGLDSARAGSTDKVPENIHFADYMHEMYGFALSPNGSCDSFFRGIGLDSSKATLHYMVNQNDFNEGYRWLVPEIIRESVRLGS